MVSCVMTSATKNILCIMLICSHRLMPKADATGQLVKFSLGLDRDQRQKAVQVEVI